MFGTIDIKTRPIRLAYLVDPSDADQVRSAIQLSSTLWGGTYFPIIPLYRRMPPSWADKPLPAPAAKDVILGYIEAFDPDVLVQFAGNVPAYVAALNLKTVKPEEIWDVLEKSRGLCPTFGIGFFEILGHVFQEHFRYKARYPVRVVIPTIPNDLSLFWAVLLGELPDRVKQVFHTHHATHFDAETMEASPEKLSELMAPEILFPRRLVQLELSVSGRSRRRSGYAYFFDAEKIGDVVDFWNLRATGAAVLPIPKQLQTNPQLRLLVAEFLKHHRRPWPHNAKVCDVASFVRSRHSTMAEMEAFAKRLDIPRPPDDPSEDGFFTLQHWYPRIWDEWARDKDGAMPGEVYNKAQSSIELSDNADRIHRIKPVWPEFAEEDLFHGEPRCANEFSFRVYGNTDRIAEVLPKTGGKAVLRAISGLTSFRDEWRVGRHGLVKLVTHDSSEARELPLARDILFAWLADHGWNPQLSPPGLLAQQIHRQLEGHASVLRHTAVLGLLEYMNGGRVKRDLSPTDREEIDPERHVEVGEVKNRLSVQANPNVHDYLLSKGVFTLGVKAKCPKCTRAFWLALAGLGDVVSCPLCLGTWPAIGNLETATWHYKTTGAFSMPRYADGAYAVLLTLELFNERTMVTLRTTPVESFTASRPDGTAIEADMAALWEDSIFGERKSGILFGECKTYGPFTAKDFRRMRSLATTFPGAVLVFSTLRKTLSRTEVKAIAGIARRGRRYWKAERPINPVMVLTGTELLARPGPPYCWDHATQKRFQHSRGLLGLCDATQQLYLGLPSWHTAWREKRERRRERLK